MTATISIIGTGHAATALGALFQGNGYRVVEVTGRRTEAVTALAGRLGAHANVQPQHLQPTLPADIYLLAISDTALPHLPPMALGATGLWVHTSGAVPLDAVAQVAQRTGVFYPLQSLRSQKSHYTTIPLLLEARNTEDLSRLTALAEGCGQPWQAVSGEQRLAYHLAAVFANNFTNHLLAEADLICQQHGLSFRHLQPLIRETVDRLQDFQPKEVQTGPAVRGDSPTMQRHLQLLAADDTAQALYRTLSAAIASRHNQKVGFAELGKMPNI